MTEKKPPPVRFVDIDLTDNVPLHPGDGYRQMLGRKQIVFADDRGRVLLVPRGPIKAPSAWGCL